MCNVIDVFSDWKEKSGSGDMQLLMLALLDKEHEMPGALAAAAPQLASQQAEVEVIGHLCHPSG